MIRKKGTCSTYATPQSSTFRRQPRKNRKGGVTALSKRPKMGSVRNLRKYLTLSDNKVQKLMTAEQPSSGSGVLTRAARRRLLAGRDDMDGEVYAPIAKKKKDGNVSEASNLSKGNVPAASTSKWKSPTPDHTDPLVSKMSALSTDKRDRSNDQSATVNQTGPSERFKSPDETSQELNPVSDNSECAFERDSALILDDQFCSFAVNNIKEQNERHQKTIHFLQSLLTIHSHHLGKCV